MLGFNNNFFGSPSPQSKGTPRGHHTPEKSIADEPMLQASSPDEIALVRFAMDMSMTLFERDRSQV